MTTQKIKKLNCKPYESFADLVIEASKEIIRHQNNFLIENNLGHLSHSSVQVLVCLEHQSMTLTELSMTLRQKPPSLLEMLRKLEQINLVQSYKILQYKQKKYWKLTTKGKKDLKKVSELIRKKGARIDNLFHSAGVPSNEVEQFRKYLLLVLNKHFRKNE